MKKILSVVITFLLLFSVVPLGSRMKIKKKGKQLFAVLISIAMIITTLPLANALTTEFAGGCGTEADPYLIETKEHLSNVRNDLNAHYKLIANIVFTDADFAEGGNFYNNQIGWIPLGQVYNTPFNGTFDGNGFAIVGLFTNSSGLFGINNGTIMNLAVVNGSVTVTTDSLSAGGIVGNNSGIITNCYSSMTVSSKYYSGGIAGKNNGIITNCYNLGNIIEGQNSSSISGGIVGYNLVGSIISSCYNAGNVCAIHQGGIAGCNYGTISHGYFLETEIMGSAQGTNAGYRCSIEELQTKSTFEGFDFDTTWEFINVPDHSFPVLKGVKHIPINNVTNQEGFESGAGTMFDPYLISNISHLLMVQQFPYACFRLANDIVFTENDNLNWNSIGTVTKPFAGYFDGDGYSIVGLTKSLFNYNKGTVKNIALKKAIVTDSATIILNNNGVLSNSYSSSEISFSSSENSSVGGLVSKNYGTINNCFYSGKINTNCTSSNYTSCYTGGIAGSNDGGTISYCYNLGIISTNKSLDGIVGINNNATMKNNYYYSFFSLSYPTTNNGGTKATVDQLKTKEFFEGFDFDKEWQIDESLEYPAPTLKIMKSMPEIDPENTDDFAGGNGSLFSPYLIANAQHLLNVSKYANSRLHFKIIDDIVLNYTFEKNMLSSFNGMLDGEMHTISSFAVKSTAFSNSYMGLFGRNNGIIKNIKFKNCNVEFSNLTESYVGTIVGYNNGIISNVEVETEMVGNDITTDDSCVGGIIGITSTNSVVENVHTIGKIDITSETELLESNIGGIIGKGNGKILDAVNDIDIVINSYVGPIYFFNSKIGGIIGSSGATIQKVRNQGNINIYVDNAKYSIRIDVGGIAGRVSGGSISFASNAGDIFMKSVTSVEDPAISIGGIVGADFRCTVTIKKSYNTGNISTLINKPYEVSVTIGGIIGYYPYIIENCYNTGKICGTTLNIEEPKGIAGGIAGHGGISEGIIKQCYNVGDISAEKMGSIVGYKYDTRLNNCYYTNAYSGVGDGSANNTYCITTQQLSNASNLSTFDFNSVWIINSNADYRFPTLRDLPHIYSEHKCTSDVGNKNFDDLQHWENCVFCGKETNIKEHSFDCICDEKCNECNYVRECGNVTNGEWESDDYKHWQLCLECDSKTNTEYHTYDNGESLTCESCNKARILTDISTSNLPIKLQYTEGEELDLSGLVVVAYYDNNTSGTITNYTVTGYSSTIGTQTITITYQGKAITFTVTVKSKTPSTITSLTYNVNGNNISKITAGTTVSLLLDGINEGEYCKVYKGNEELSANDIIGTGMVVKIIDGNTVTAQYTVIVTGDTNGDGKVNITDMIAIKAHVLEKTLLSGVYAIAADTSGEGNISITDFIQVKSKILGKSDIVAR